MASGPCRACARSYQKSSKFNPPERNSHGPMASPQPIPAPECRLAALHRLPLCGGRWLGKKDIRMNQANNSMGHLRYEPGEHRRKHCWQQPYADFENNGVAVIGKCSSTLSKAMAEQLLNGAVWFWARYKDRSMFY